MARKRSDATEIRCLRRALREAIYAIVFARSFVSDGTSTKEQALGNLDYCARTAREALAPKRRPRHG